MNEGYLAFSVAKEHFAISLFQIEEILDPQSAIPVPEAPHFVEGIVNIRGTVLPLVNLKRRFGARGGGGEEGQIVVVDPEGMGTSPVGLRVDAVQGILHAEEVSVEPLPEVALTAVNRDFLKEVLKKKEELIFLLDLQKILTSQERKKLVEGEIQGGRALTRKEGEEQREELYVQFALEGQSFAAPIESVSEVLPLERIRPIPFTPPEFLGLVNLRGDVLWVVDIRRFLGLPAEQHAFQKGLVVHVEEVHVAFPIEEPAMLISVRRDSILPALSTLEGVHSDLFRGEYVRAAAEDRQVVVLLEISRLIKAILQGMARAE